MTDRIEVFTHSSIRIQGNSTTIYIDPFKIREEFRDADYVFVTHQHYDHFSIEDILQYFRDKVLEKWLCVRGYNEELEAIKKITSTSPYDIIKELVSIFNIESDKDKIEYSTSIITYRESRILANQKYKEEGKTVIVSV